MSVARLGSCCCPGKHTVKMGAGGGVVCGVCLVLVIGTFVFGTCVWYLCLVLVIGICNWYL